MQTSSAVPDASRSLERSRRYVCGNGIIGHPGRARTTRSRRTYGFYRNSYTSMHITHSSPSSSCLRSSSAALILPTTSRRRAARWSRDASVSGRNLRVARAGVCSNIKRRPRPESDVAQSWTLRPTLVEESSQKTPRRRKTLAEVRGRGELELLLVLELLS